MRKRTDSGKGSWAHRKQLQLSQSNIMLCEDNLVVLVDGGQKRANKNVGLYFDDHGLRAERDVIPDPDHFEGGASEGESQKVCG